MLAIIDFSNLSYYSYIHLYFYTLLSDNQSLFINVITQFTFILFDFIDLILYINLFIFYIL